MNSRSYLEQITQFHRHGVHTRVKCVENLIYGHDVTWGSWRLKSPQYDSYCNSLLRLQKLKATNVFIARPLLGNPHSVYCITLTNSCIIMRNIYIYIFPCHIRYSRYLPDASLTNALSKPHHNDSLTCLWRISAFVSINTFFIHFDEYGFTATFFIRHRVNWFCMYVYFHFALLWPLFPTSFI